MTGATLSGIVKAHGAVQVVRGIDLNVAEKEFVIPAGPSCCGKSTTPRMIAGPEAMTLADRVVLMNDGAIEQVGTPMESFDDPANTFVAGFLGRQELLKVMQSAYERQYGN